MQPHRPRSRLTIAPMSLPNVIRLPAVTRRLGSALLSLMPGRVAELKAGRLPDAPDFLDNMLIAGLVHDHQQRGRLDELTALHDWFWTHGPATEFHEFAETRFEHYFLGNHVAIVAALRMALEAEGAPRAAICEIGCGSGRVLQYLAREFPGIPRIVGLDLSAEQVERNRVRYVAERMQFEAGDGLEWVSRHARPGWIHLSYGGVLEYMARARVLELYRLLATRLAPSIMVLVEPLAADHDLEREPESKVYGAENTFSHNHVALLQEAGFALLSRFEQQVDGQRWLLIVARSAAPAASSPAQVRA